MYLVVIAWLYVTVMMAIAEATSTEGTVLGGIVTFLLYGLAPMSLVIYLMATPSRKRAIKEKEAAEHAAWLAQQAQSAAAPEAATSNQPDAGSHAPAAAEAVGVAPVRKEA